MTTTADTPQKTPSPDLPDGRSESKAPRSSGRARGLMAATAVAVVAITGGVIWLTAGSSGGDAARQPVQIVQDHRWGGPDVYEHGRLPDGGFGTTGTQYGSADSLERHAANRAE
jgi:hypothetical protein